MSHSKTGWDHEHYQITMEEASLDNDWQQKWPRAILLKRLHEKNGIC